MQGYGYGYGYPMGHEYLWHPLMSIVCGIIVLIIVLAVLRNVHGKHWRHHHHGGALETLRERYAKGEISTSEYEERKKALIAE